MPVGGISWYESVAYARFRHLSLPTIHHWTRAAFGPFEGAFETAPAVAAAAILSLRGAGMAMRLYAWLSMLVLICAAAGADALHATATRLPHRTAAATSDCVSLRHRASAAGDEIVRHPIRCNEDLKSGKATRDFGEWRPQPWRGVERPSHPGEGRPSTRKPS
jgi:hypothetical protein